MNRIRELREEKNLTQQLLGEKLQTTTKNIYRWENELTEMSTSTLLRLADFFEVSVDYILCRENDIGIISLSNELTPFQNNLLEVVNKLSRDDQFQVLGFAQALSN